MYVRDNFSTEVLRTVSKDGLQILAAEIEIMTHKKVIVLGLYRSPSFPLPSFLKELTEFVSMFHNNDMILIGDFNVDLLSGAVPFEFSTFFDRYGFSQHVPFHTSDYGSLLDHFWSNSSPKTEVGCFKTYYSDHSPIWVRVLL